MIKKTKRLHRLYQDWLKIKKMKIDQDPNYQELRKNSGIKGDLFSQPMAGKWYYEYRNNKGGYVGLAKLQNHNVWLDSRKWMWETCTTNKGMELRRFHTQKKAEEQIYKFLK